jgi:hypothetical protein
MKSDYVMKGGKKFSPNVFCGARLLVAACLVVAFAQSSALAGEVTLEDDSLRVAFDTDSGALTRLENKATHWVIERRPELGVSFRLFAPLPQRRYNPVFGQKQHARVEKISDHEVRMQWQDLTSENGGVLPLTLSATVTLTNGVLTFGAILRNDSSLVVETVDYPYFGDFNPPTRTTSLAAYVMTNNVPSHLKSDEVYPRFGNEKGYWGVDYPTKTLEAQPSPFCLMQTPDQGLYIGVGHPAYRLQYTFEQHPGVISSTTGLVPPMDEISGLPVHLEFRTCHFIFAQPHSTTVLTPVVVRGYTGDWQAGMAIYKP